MIQSLSRLGRIFSRIIAVFCIVIAVICAFCVLSVAFLPNDSFEFVGITMRSIYMENSELSIGEMYTSLTVAIIICSGEAILCWFAERYFSNELKAGTPFTHEGARELLRLGILTLTIPILSDFIAALTETVMANCFGITASAEISSPFSFGIGIMLIIVSAIFRFGADQQGSKGS